MTFMDLFGVWKAFHVAWERKESLLLTSRDNMLQEVVQSTALAIPEMEERCVKKSANSVRLLSVYTAPIIQLLRLSSYV